jgi:thiosulfate reductase cytochrome b subunit
MIIYTNKILGVPAIIALLHFTIMLIIIFFIIEVENALQHT